MSSSRLRILASICLFVLSTSYFVLASRGDWPQFRGPQGSSVSSETNLPIKWSAAENIRWKVDLPGRGLSNPVIAAGKVYVTACTGYLQDRLHVLCFDQATGKKLWERQFWATGLVGCHPKTSMAAPTPVTDGQRVYALFATCDLACLDADGNLVWYRSLTGDYPTLTNQVGMAASPVLAGDTLVILMENAGESFAVGIDKLTGKNRWKIERERQINWTTPVVLAKGAEVLLQSPKELTAVDSATGQKRWGFETKGIATASSAVADNGTIFLPASEFTALKPRTDGGTPDLIWASNRLRPGYSSAVVHKDRVYTLNQGILVCADAADGKILWQERLKGPFSASPVIADGKLYAVNEEGQTFVVQLGDKPQLLATNELKSAKEKDYFLATPAISGGAIFLRCDGHLWCIGDKKPN
jgi:outer membrane protein assembly factor BamB